MSESEDRFDKEVERMVTRLNHSESDLDCEVVLLIRSLQGQIRAVRLLNDWLEKDIKKLKEAIS